MVTGRSWIINISKDDQTTLLSLTLIFLFSLTSQYCSAQPKHCTNCDTIDLRSETLPETLKEYLIGSYLFMTQHNDNMLGNDPQQILNVNLYSKDTLVTDPIKANEPTEIEITNRLSSDHLSLLIFCTDKNDAPCATGASIVVIDEQGNVIGDSLLAWVLMDSLSSQRKERYIYRNE